MKNKKKKREKKYYVDNIFHNKRAIYKNFHNS